MGQVFWWMNYHSNACCDVSHCSQLSSCQMMEHQTCKSKGFCLSICFPTLGSSFKDSSREYFSGEAEQVPCWNVNHNSGFQTSGASLWAILETGCRGWGAGAGEASAGEASSSCILWKQSRALLQDHFPLKRLEKRTLRTSRMRTPASAPLQSYSINGATTEGKQQHTPLTKAFIKH